MLKTNRPIARFAPVIILVVIFTVTTCKKEPESVVTPKDEPLTEAQDNFLAAVKDTVFRLEDMILEDGQNVRSFLEKYDSDFLEAHPSGKMSRAAGQRSEGFITP